MRVSFHGLGLCLAMCITSCAEHREERTGVGQKITWTECPWSTEERASAECATIDVPLDHLAPQSETFEIRVKRRLAQGHERGVLFLLAGGPGAAATEHAEDLSHGVYRSVADLSIYAVDARGTGGSERLSCPELTLDPSGIRDCIASLSASHGDHLSFMSTEQSARDLAFLAEQVVPAGAQLFLYGGSYGTYLAQRFLEVAPWQASGVVLEGIASPHLPFDGYDAGMDETARRLLERCPEDPHCAEVFSSNAYERAQQAVASLDAGECAALAVASDDMRLLLGSLLTYSQTHGLVAPLVQRLERCSAADVEVLKHAFDSFGDLDAAGDSDVLGIHVGLTELVSRPLAKLQLRDALSGYPVNTGLEARLADFDPIWPAASELRTEETNPYRGPMLMLQGNLDPATPIERARETGARFDAPGQVLVEFPGAAHDVIGAPVGSGETCAYQLLVDFLRDPSAPVRVGCARQHAHDPLAIEPAVAEYVLGTVDAWGDGAQ